jgi:hypothetical protein
MKNEQHNSILYLAGLTSVLLFASPVVQALSDNIRHAAAVEGGFGASTRGVSAHVAASQLPTAAPVGPARPGA